MSLTRRDFLTASSLGLAASALDLRTLVAQAAQTPQAPPQTAFTMVRGTVGYFTGQGGVIGWHVDPKSAAVIDSQFAATATICLEGIRKRAGGRRIDVLVNTHHHGDHTGGNGVFRPVTRSIIAHSNVPALQREAAATAAKNAKPGAPPPPELVFADTTYEDTWRQPVGSETLALKHYVPAHTGGDSVVTFEKANVVHMGDLVFNRRHPVIDRPGGASIANWVKVLDTVAAEHTSDTIYIFGHSAPKFPITGTKADLAYMRDYLSALIELVRGEMKAGKSREEIVKITDPLMGYPDHGPLTARVLGGAYDELAGS